MPPPSDPAGQIAALSKAVQDLTNRIAALERGAKAPLPSVPTLAAVPMAQTPISHSRTVTVNPGARWATAIAGFIALWLGDISGGLVVLGFIALIIALIWPWTRKVVVQPITDSTQPSSSPTAKPLAPAAPRQPSRFEQDLAKHWFSWLGIISLVVGVTLFLNYAFRGLGPIGQVFTGYAVAGMLFGLWYWLKRLYKGFAFVLQGGGWAIVYISTYMLHVINGQPVSSAITAGWLLLIVVAVIIVAAHLQRSKALTAGAFFLGYVTAFTNDVNLFTLVTLLLLSVGAVAVAILEVWPEFVFTATIVTYIVQAAWMLQQFSLAEVAGTAAGFLILEALVFGAAHWLLSPTTVRQRYMTVAGTILNLVGFYVLFNYMVRITANPNGWLATLFIGIVCVVLAAATALTPTRRFLRPIYTVFAIAFVTLSLGQWLHGDTLTWAYLIESTAVVCLGAIMNERTIRYSAYAVSCFALLSLLGVLSGPVTNFGTTAIHARLVLGLLGSVLTAISAAVLRYRKNILPGSERYAAVIFADIAIALAVAVAGQELRPAWVPVVWSVGGLAAMALGLQMRSFNARAVGYIIALLAAVAWIANVMNSTALSGTLNVHARLLSGLWVVMLNIVGSFLIRLRIDRIAQDEKMMSAAYAWTAVILLTVVLGAEIPTRLLSVAWGVEGVILYIIGFAAQSIQARRQGLMLLVLTIAKVYVIDVQTLKTPYRILSFIILGVILLGVGFLYNRWRQQKTLPSK